MLDCVYILEGQDQEKNNAFNLIETRIEKSTEDIVDKSLASDIFDAQEEDSIEDNKLLAFSDSGVRC